MCYCNVAWNSILPPPPCPTHTPAPAVPVAQPVYIVQQPCRCCCEKASGK